MAFKLQTVEVDGKTYAVVQDGKPVYVDEADASKTTTYDLEYSNGTISRLQRENGEHRQRAQAAEDKLKAFEGIEDPDAARQAVETMKNIDQKSLLAADKVEELKRGVQEAVKAQYENRVKELEGQVNTLSGERDGLRTQLDTEVIGGGFAKSEFVSKKTILPPDVAEAYFGKHFKVENINGKPTPVAYDAAGNQIYSRTKPSELAGFDEALEVLVDAYPRKTSILAGTRKPGPGEQPSGGGGGDKTITRAAFDQLGANERMAAVRDGMKVVD